MNDSEPWKAYILSPESRSPGQAIPYLDKVFIATIRYERIVSHSEDVTIGDGINGDRSITINDKGLVTVDFGREVGGLILFTYTIDGPSPIEIALSFTESPSFIGPNSDDTGATPSMDWDGSLTARLDPGFGVYRLPKEKFRGGFRFLTIIGGSGPVKLDDLRCEIGFAPDARDLRKYTGYFWSDDDLLNRIWYAGAYTCQTNIVPNNTGRYLPQVKPGWQYDATLGSGPIGAPILVDGAKRDRAVWPGDLGIAIPSTMLAFGPELGWPAVKNALLTVLDHQDPKDGMLAFAGPATMSHINKTKSQPYHLWGLIGLAIAYDWGGQAREWVSENFTSIVSAVESTIRTVSSTGLVTLSHCSDWARTESPGHKISTTALTFAALRKMAALSESIGRSEHFRWLEIAGTIKQACNVLLWDDEAGLFRESPETYMHPQDGNAIAVAFGLPNSTSRSARISEALRNRWNDIGPICPELPDNISPFISGVEVLAHFSAGQSETALALIRRLWGYMLDAPQMGGTTFVEGMTLNGGLNYRGSAGYNNDPSYCSMSHSWSSGPTPALTYHLLGLQHSRPSLDPLALKFDAEWAFLPMPDGHIRSVRGGFETLEGTFDGSWSIQNGEFVASVSPPRSLRNGVLGIPLRWGKVVSMMLNGDGLDGRKVGSWMVFNVAQGGIYNIIANIISA